MARFEKGLGENGKAPLSLDDLLTLLDEGAALDEDAAGPSSRHLAIARYLAGGDGWREAVAQLGGAFALSAPGLTEDQKG